MNNSQPSQVSRPWLWWSVACLVLLSAVVMLSRTGRLPRRATVTIDTKGTARLGGVFPLQNKTVRDVALTAAGYLNGGTASIVAAESTSFSNLVETFGAMRKAGITSVTLRTESSSPKQQLGTETEMKPKPSKKSLERTRADHVHWQFGRAGPPASLSSAARPLHAP